MSVYDVDDVVTLTAFVTDVDGDPANAGGMTLTLTAPDGTTSTPTVTNTVTGTYEAIVTVTQAGRWDVEWVATGANASAWRTTFTGVEHPASFSYAGDPALSDRDRVRFLLQDTTEPGKFTDQEIDFLLTEWGDPYAAAWNGADTLAATFAAQANTSKRIGDLALSDDYSAQSQQYSSLADRLKNTYMRRYPAAMWTSPEDANSTTDPYFVGGQFDNG